ncbi:hypothetical protein AX774_g5930 [Zancudomyces culisetae]|uniref:Uncharacterized protein n=1 Tax=Zancudomyces culisetae TaxID=1213189 RepID=A0A1R1PI14_ZANCU|nr:hypothetical protein AX774_g5930 [Zancudomyces culisetae]|eukprot:OMH80624.1 hypothetical protein AX774_g5930 [Zancudomyces culisetae]
MVAIEETMRQLESTGDEDMEGVENIEDIEEEGEFESQIGELQEKLNATLRELQVQKERCDEEKTAKEEALRQLENVNQERAELAKARSGGSTDALLRAEVETLRKDVERLETQMEQQHAQLENALLSVKEKNLQLSKYHGDKAELERLRDREQEYKHLADKLAKTENVVDKYRVKIEESSEWRKKAYQLEQQLKQEVENRRQLETDYVKMLKHSDRKKGQQNDTFSKLESQLNLSDTETQEYVTKIAELQDEKIDLVDSLNKAQEYSRELEDRIKYLELDGPASVQMSLSDEFGENPIQMKAELDSLRKEVEELTKELETATERSTTNNSNLSTQLAEKEKELDALNEAYMASKNESIRSTSQVEAISAELNKTTQQLQMVQLELEKTKSELGAIDQDKVQALKTMKASAEKEIEGYRNEIKSLESRYSVKELECKQKAEQLEALLLEKNVLDDELRKLTNYKQSASKEVALSEEQKAQISELTEKLNETRRELHNAQVGLKKAKEVIKANREEFERLKLSTSGGSGNAAGGSGSYVELETMFKSQIESKQRQIDQLHEMLTDSQQQKDYENRLISSAWFYIQRKIEQKSGFGHSSDLNLTTAGFNNSSLSHGGGSSTRLSRNATGGGGSSGTSWLETQRSYLDPMMYKR